jgi:membrane DNA delivery protein
MGKELIDALVTIATAIVGVAIISVIVGSPNTSNVIKSAGSAFSSDLKAAVSPALGGGGFGGFSGGAALPTSF